MTALVNPMRQSPYQFYSPTESAPNFNNLFSYYQRQLNGESEDDSNDTNLARVEPSSVPDDSEVARRTRPTSRAGRSFTEAVDMGNQQMEKLMGIFQAYNPGYLDSMLGVADKYDEKRNERYRQNKKDQYDAEERNLLTSELFQTDRYNTGQSYGFKNQLVSGW